MIDAHTIQTLLETARIEEVIGSFIHLRKRGVNLIGHCPFHNEKTPSFTVSPAKNLFKCFGCGKGGNTLTFIMEHEKLTYPEAIRFLAARYHIEIEEKEQTPEEKEAKNEQESLMAVTSFATQYFTDTLFNTEQGKAIGLTYFKKRGFTAPIMQKFQLGYCSDERDGFTRKALDQGYQLTFLEKSGLTIAGTHTPYDRFQGRVMFPIHSISGRVIGFGGRILSSETNKAKYVNSPESEIYNKSASLYGIYFARNAILSKDNCFLVEGYTDVLALHQAGIENTVASSGTSLTADQIKLIRRFTSNITILYDGDEAGIKASFRGIDMILEEGMHVKIVPFPAGEDPDSYVRKHTPEEVIHFLNDEAKNFILLKTTLLLSEAKEDPIQRAGLVKEIVHSISLIPDAIARNIYLKECSQLMNIPEQTLVNELNKEVRKNYDRKSQPSASTGRDEVPDLSPSAEPQHLPDFSESEFQERDIIRLLLNYSQEEISAEVSGEEGGQVMVKVGSFIIEDLLHDEIQFSNPLYAQVFAEYAQHYQKGILLDYQYFSNHQQETVARIAVDLLSSPYVLSKNWLEKKKISVLTEKQVLTDAVTSSLLSFKLRKVEKMMTDSQRILRKVSSEEGAQDLLQKLHHLTQIKKVLSEKLGRIITR